jgi:N-dimethylarginine dimethylaminohydrolase
MEWKTLEQRTWFATSESGRVLPGVYLALVDGVIMGKVIAFGITNRCRYCKGTGLNRKLSCLHCKGLGYTEPDDTCMHVCGCSNPVGNGLVFVCLACFNEECDYPESAWAFV